MIGIKDIFALLGRFGVPITTKAKTKARPTGAELRNPANPFQAQRIKAAAAKRQRKAEKLAKDAFVMSRWNRAHGGLKPVLGDTFAFCVPNNLNPFYIAE